MPIEDLNRELYNPNSEKIDQRNQDIAQSDPFLKKSDASPFMAEENWGKPENGLTKKQKRNLWILGSIAFLIVVGLIWFIYYQVTKKDAFHQDRVTLSFQGPKEVDSTQLVKYKIHYKNANRVTLKDAELLLNYTENFQPTNNINLKFLNPQNSRITIGDIKPNEEADIDLEGIFYAPKDFPVYVRASLKYTPSNRTEALENKGQFGVNITSAPVFLEVSAPQNLSNGDVVEYIVDYKNLDLRRMEGLKIEIEFPEGFELKEAKPAASERDQIWYLGAVEANQGGRILIRGTMKGERDQVKSVKASLGTTGKDGQFVMFNQRERSSKIVIPALSIEQMVEGPKNKDYVKSGETLTFVYKFKNNGDIALRDAIVTAEVHGTALEMSKISPLKGAFDASKGIVTWKASDIPQLALIEPKQEGEVRLSVPIKNIIPIASAKDKNLVVTSIAKIDSLDVPTPIGENKVISTNRLEIKVGTKVMAEALAFYNDSRIKNNGPIPLQVGKETTYTVHWAISNVSNDLANVKVVSTLPSGIKWMNNIYPATESIIYNERTNELEWNVGKVLAGRGILGPKHEISFQVSVMPQPTDVGKMPVLVNAAKLTGKDEFTGEEIVLEIGSKDTQIPEDKKVSISGYKVEATQP